MLKQSSLDSHEINGKLHTATLLVVLGQIYSGLLQPCTFWQALAVNLLQGTLMLKGFI